MTDTCADIESLRRVVTAAGWRRIGIDGVDAAGRSSVAEKLVRSLECPVLDVDDYVYRNQGGYVDFIDYPALSAALSPMPAFILHGACLLEVLSNLGLTLDAQVYIKRIRGDRWIDEGECEFPEGIDAALEYRARNSALISSYFDERMQQAIQDEEDSPAGRHEEIMRYHDTWHPQDEADVVFERADSAG